MESKIIELMSESIKNMRNIVLLTFDLEIQGQTLRKAYNIISLLVCIYQRNLILCLQLLLNRCQGNQKYDNILTLTFEI